MSDLSHHFQVDVSLPIGTPVCLAEKLCSEGSMRAGLVIPVVQPGQSQALQEISDLS